MAKPVVAIIGRQNVGKSTLLNRLAGRRVAIVADMPGTTRDRIFADVSWQGAQFTLVDTGGLEMAPRSKIARGIRAQVEAAITEADAIIFLVDVKDGLVASDFEIAQVLRHSSKPLALVANKADNPALEGEAVEFYQLGLGEPLVISAYHGRHIGELLDRIVLMLPPAKAVESRAQIMKLAIVGRPNVGKSTLLNAILGEERAIVDEAPGTTLDAVNTLLDFSGQNVILIDTAGIRRRGRWGAGVERYSVIRALRAIDEADVVLLVLDGTELVTAQDKHIAGYIQEAAKGVVLIVNKWDLAGQKSVAECNKYIRSELKFMPHAPILYISAKFGHGVDKLMPQAFAVYEERLRRIPETLVREVVEAALSAHPLPRKGQRQLKIFSSTQTGTNPPTFVFLVNDAGLIHFSYQRYLENKLRQALGFAGTPLRLIFKTRGEA